ncbi:MAG: hypothetical protein CMD26_02890, partial [Flavobacteriales bacterium]|nr:hypothetical protein [Flavobacteriales bacterium]
NGCELIIVGCTDATACNYDATANTDEGCVYADANADCNGECLDSYADFGNGCELIIVGCTDENACNYDAAANTDDNSCEFVDGICDTCEDGVIVDNDLDNDGICDNDEISGCTDEEACNYNSDATDEDGSCEFVDGICDTCEDGVVVDNDIDNDGICDDSDPCPNDPENDGDGDGICDDIDPCPNDEFNLCIVGCTDDTACNYNENVITDDGSCTYALGCDYCSGEVDGTGVVIDGDEDNDGICDVYEIYGCDDISACNYNIFATENDGSCEYVEDLYPDQLFDSNGDGINDSSAVDCNGDCISDIDEDGVCDELDNCPDTYNPDQEDEYEPGGPGDACDGIGLSEDNIIEWSIYPNPASSTINIDYQSNYINDINVEIFNSIGEVVFSENFNSLNTLSLAVDVNNYADGVYQVRIIGGNNLETKLFIVH